MRTRHAASAADEAPARSASRRAATATAAAASASTAKKRVTPAAKTATATTPAKSRSRSASTRTPLAVKNTLSSHSSSNTPALSGSGDLLLSPRNDADDALLEKNPGHAKAIAKHNALSRPSLADMVDDALRPIEQAARPKSAQSTRGIVTALPSQKTSIRHASASSSVSSAARSTSVASLLSERRGGRAKAKKVVAATGFYAQAAPPPAFPKVPPRAAPTSKARAAESYEPQALSRSPSPSPEPESVPASAQASLPKVTIPATKPNAAKATQPTRQPLQPLKPMVAPAQSTSTTRTQIARPPSTHLAAGPPAFQKRKGMVVWDDEDDDDWDEKGGHIDDDDDDDAEPKGKGKDTVSSSPGSSDKENRDPHAHQDSVSRTAVDVHRTLAAVPRVEIVGTPTKLRTPLGSIAEAGPSHSTPLTGSDRATKAADKGKAPIRGSQRPKLSEILGLSQSSSSGQSLVVPTPSLVTDMSSSIPASDDVYLYTKSAPANAQTGRRPSPMKAAGIGADLADSQSVGQTAAEDEPSLIADFGGEQDALPQLEEQPSNTGEEFIDWEGQDEQSQGGPHPEKQDAAGDAEDNTDSGDDDDDDDDMEAVDGIIAPVEASRSFDPVEDPFGFFAAEAKLRAQRAAERERNPPAAREAMEADDVDVEEEPEGRPSAVYGLDLRPEERAFAQRSSPASSDDDGEAGDAGSKDGVAGLERPSGTDVAQDAPSSAELVADESASPVRRSSRVRGRKEPVIEVSDSDLSEDEEEPGAGGRRPGTKNRDGDSARYDTDSSPPGLVRSTLDVRRRIGTGGRPGPAVAAVFGDEFFDSDDEPLPSSGSASLENSARGKKAATKRKGKTKAKAGESKELRLSDLVKLLPRRATSATYGSKKKARTASSSKPAKSSGGSSSASKARTRRAQTVSDDEAEGTDEDSDSSLPSPARVVADPMSRRKRRAPGSEEEKEKEDEFTSDSDGEAPKLETKKGRTRGAPADTGATKARGRKGAALPAWTRAGGSDGPKSTRTASGSSRKRGRGAGKDDELSGASDEEDDAMPPKKKAAAPPKKAAAKVSAAKSDRGSQSKSKTDKSRSSPVAKSASRVKKRAAKGQEERVRDELDDFELDTELVI